VEQTEQKSPAKQIAETIIGTSPALRAAIAATGRVGPRRVSVLVEGETGTGKESIARLVHAHSGRQGRFVAVNCAAIAPDILEAELFGYERGAFTGADRQKRGLFEVADGGTLFLDEIGEMAPALQAKLLRVIQDPGQRCAPPERGSAQRASRTFACLDEAAYLRRWPMHLGRSRKRDIQ